MERESGECFYLSFFFFLSSSLLLFSLSLFLSASLSPSLSLSSHTSQRVQHDEGRVPQPHQRPRHLRTHFFEGVERIAQHLGAAPAEEQRDEVELEVDRSGLQEGDVTGGAGLGGEVDDAPEGPDAGEDLDDCGFFSSVFRRVCEFFRLLRGWTKKKKEE